MISFRLSPAAARVKRPSVLRREALCARACAGIPDRLLLAVAADGGFAPLLDLLAAVAAEIEARAAALDGRVQATRAAGVGAVPPDIQEV